MHNDWHWFLFTFVVSIENCNSFTYFVLNRHRKPPIASRLVNIYETLYFESCKDIRIFLYMAAKFDVIHQFDTYVLLTNDHMLIFQEDPADKKPCS